MTVMQWGNSEGLKGRCDANCHNATGQSCNCMCGGLYHGTATKGTFEDVRRIHGREIIAHAKKLAKEKGFVLEVTEDGQPTLF